MSPSVAELEHHRAALVGHCYRMLGSPVDADDAVQETMVRAWKALARFDGRSSLRTWLYRIATNVCLDALADRKQRTLSIIDGPVCSVDDELATRDRTHWLEPIPDTLALPHDADPAERAILRQSIRLAFVAALQQLPAKQRAALLLTEVLGWSAAEVAESLDSTVPAINSALQRARATLATQAPASELTATQRALVDRYFEAFERYDVDALTSLMVDDATLAMPPYTMWLQGRESIRAWLLGRGSGCRGSRLVPTLACGVPAFGQYRDGGETPFALIVLEPAANGELFGSMTSFLDTARLFPVFGLPPKFVSADR